MPGIKKLLSSIGKKKGKSAKFTLGEQNVNTNGNNNTTPVAPPRQKNKKKKSRGSDDVPVGMTEVPVGMTAVNGSPQISARGSSGYSSSQDNQHRTVNVGDGNDFADYVVSDAESVDDADVIEQLQDQDEDYYEYSADEYSMDEDVSRYEGLEEKFLKPVDDSGFYVSGGFQMDMPPEGASIYNITYSQTKAGCQDDKLEAGQSDELTKSRRTHWWNAQSLGTEAVYADDNNITFREKRPEVHTLSRADVNNVVSYAQPSSAGTATLPERFQKHKEKNDQRLYNTLSSAPSQSETSTLARVKKNVAKGFRTLTKRHSWSSDQEQPNELSVSQQNPHVLY